MPDALAIGAGARGRPQRGRVLADAALRRRRRADSHRSLAQRPGRRRPAALPQGRGARIARADDRPRGDAAGVRARRTGASSGRDTPTSASRCRRRRRSGPRRTPKGCSTPLTASAGSGRGSIGRRWEAPPDTACRCRSSARPRRARSDFAGIDQVVTTTQNGRGEARGAGALLVRWARRTSVPSSSTDVILFSADEFGWLLAAGRMVHRVEHHAAEAQSRSVRADARPRRRARGRSRHGAWR